MKVIRIDSEAYQELLRKIDCISEYVKQSEARNAMPDPDPSEVWISDEDAAVLMQVSRRTMQRLRSNGKITYSIRNGGKVWYTLAEIKRVLPGQVINRKTETGSEHISSQKGEIVDNSGNANEVQQ